MAALVAIVRNQYFLRPGQGENMLEIIVAR